MIGESQVNKGLYEEQKQLEGNRVRSYGRQCHEVKLDALMNNGPSSRVAEVLDGRKSKHIELYFS